MSVQWKDEVLFITRKRRMGLRESRKYPILVISENSTRSSMEGHNTTDGTAARSTMCAES